MSQNKAKQHLPNETEPTNSDILSAINQFATHVEQRFQGVDQQFQSVEQRFQDIEQRFQGVDQQFQSVEQRFQSVDEHFNKIELTMVTKDELKDKLAAMETRLVTKDYLDEKLYDLKSDMIVTMRKEDHKIDTVVDILQEKNIFSAADSARVLKATVFPKPTT